MTYTPHKIRKFIENMDIAEIKDGHCSGDLVYKVENKYILKISENIQRLEREKKINDYLKDKLPVSESVAFEIENDRAYYLKTMVQGESLLEKKYLENPYLTAEILAKAIKMIHSIDTNGCEFYNGESKGNVFVHGDMCLPNVLARGNEVSGIIDTESCGIGDSWIDYAWCIWSFEYNMGTKVYTPILLEKLGIEFDEEKYKQYINEEELK